MIHVLAVLAIATGCILSAYFCSKDCNRKENVVGVSIITFVISSLLILGPLGLSYCEYLNIKADYYGVIAQYGSTIDIYADKAIINVDKISFTDLKYQGYQKEMADLIKGLRYKVANYNSIYIKKKILHENLIFNWVIIPPDSGMKLLQMFKESDKGKILLMMPAIKPGE